MFGRKNNDGRVVEGSRGYFYLKCRIKAFSLFSRHSDLRQAQGRDSPKRFAIIRDHSRLRGPKNSGGHSAPSPAARDSGFQKLFIPELLPPAYPKSRSVARDLYELRILFGTEGIVSLVCYQGTRFNVPYRQGNDSLSKLGVASPECIFAIGISRYAREGLLIPKLLPPAFFLLWRFVFEHRLVAEAKKSASTCRCMMSGRLSRKKAP